MSILFILIPMVLCFGLSLFLKYDDATHRSWPVIAHISFGCGFVIGCSLCSVIYYLMNAIK